jgi:hypothetical protein
MNEDRWSKGYITGCHWETGGEDVHTNNGNKKSYKNGQYRTQTK